MRKIRLLSLLLLATLLFTLVSCGNPPSNGDETTEGPTTEVPTTEAATTEAPTTETPTTESPTTEITTAAPEAEEATTEEPTPQKFVYKHVIIVGIQGMATFHLDAETPNIDAIFADYALTNVAQSYFPSKEGPCWLSMLTGMDPKVMRVTQNPEYCSPRDYKNAIDKYPTLFKLVHDKYPDAAVASISRWDAFQELVCADDYIYTAGSPVEWTAEEEKQNALDYIETIDPSKNNFAFFCFAELDSLSHKIPRDSEEFKAAITEADAYVGEIFNAIEAKGMLEDTLFILAADHGDCKHTNTSFTEDELTITLGFRGKTVNNTKDFPMLLRDIAPVVAEAMGLEPSPAWETGKFPPSLPEGIFLNIE